MTRVMCMYCAKWINKEDATPMSEKGKVRIEYYCDRCLPEVKSNLRKLPWFTPDFYIFGKKEQN